jgi:hypothetical protein
MPIPPPPFERRSHMRNREPGAVELTGATGGPSAVYALEDSAGAPSGPLGNGGALGSGMATPFRSTPRAQAGSTASCGASSVFQNAAVAAADFLVMPGAFSAEAATDGTTTGVATGVVAGVGTTGVAANGVTVTGGVLAATGVVIGTTGGTGAAGEETLDALTFTGTDDAATGVTTGDAGSKAISGAA